MKEEISFRGGFQMVAGDYEVIATHTAFENCIDKSIQYFEYGGVISFKYMEETQFLIYIEGSEFELINTINLEEKVIRAFLSGKSIALSRFKSLSEGNRLYIKLADKSLLQYESWIHFLKISENVEFESRVYLQRLTISKIRKMKSYDFFVENEETYVFRKKDSFIGIYCALKYLQLKVFIVDFDYEWNEESWCEAINSKEFFEFSRKQRGYITKCITMKKLEPLYIKKVFEDRTVIVCTKEGKKIC